MSERTVLVPDESHPITVSPTAQRVRVHAGDILVAVSERSLTLAEKGYPDRYYVPDADLDHDLLAASETHTWCPYKGEASYWSVRTGDGVVDDAGWYYPAPHDAVAEVADHVAFDPDRVRVELG